MSRAKPARVRALNAYLLMVAVYLLAALLAALDSALTSLELIPWFAGLRWLRVHLITLGAVTQAVFGLLPALVARQTGQRRPAARLEIWLLLNAGLILLIAGVPAVNGTLIFGGGTLLFMATLLLLWQLRGQQAGTPVGSVPRPGTGRAFYLGGLGFLLIGILAGTGLWLGWGGPLQMARPKEVHLHANIWGFTALVFAGLLVDIVPRVTARAVAWPRTLPAIFWLMSGGSLLLLIAPWAGINQLTAPGMVLMLAATLWLLLSVIVPLRGARSVWSQPGIWHLLTAYYWVLTPVFALPVVLAVGGSANVPRARIEQDAPQWLIYGWLLHFAYALLPYFYRRAAHPSQPAGLGGSWFSLAAVHLGSLFFWAGIFAGEAQAALQGAGYFFWAASMAPILFSLWQHMRRSVEPVESGS